MFTSYSLLSLNWVYSNVYRVSETKKNDKVLKKAVLESRKQNNNRSLHFLFVFSVKLDRSISVIKRLSRGVPRKMRAQSLRRGMDGMPANFICEDTPISRGCTVTEILFTVGAMLLKCTYRFCCAYQAQSFLVLARE